jgi:hypothetical protein
VPVAKQILIGHIKEYKLENGHLSVSRVGCAGFALNFFRFEKKRTEKQDQINLF